VVRRQVFRIDTQDAAVRLTGRPVESLNQHQPIRIAEGERAEQHPVREAENRHIGTNPKRQRQHRHRREAGGAPQEPHRIVRVAAQHIDVLQEGLSQNAGDRTRPQS
jgi:hypothetical protein